MKKTDIAFSGFMAAILFSASASAATTQIASKTYVDNRETSILQTVSNTYETKENVTNLTEQVTQLGDTINNEETGLAAKVDDAAAAAAEAKQTADTAQSTATGAQSAVEALGATVGNAEAGLVKDVNDLETTVGQLDTEMDSKLDSATAATTYEVLSNKAAAINEGNQTSPTAYPSVGAIVQWTNKKIADLSDTGLPVNPGNIEDGTIAGSKLENGAITTDKIADDVVTSDKIAPSAVGTTEIADGAVSEAKLDTALAGKIDGKEDKANKTDTIDAMSTEDQYPSASAVYTALGTKADKTTVEGLAEDVAGLDDALNNKTTGLATQITNVKNTADQALAGLATKQNTLTAEQQAAVDSGITKAKVTAYDGYATEIAKKLDSTAAASTYATQASVTEALADKQEVLGYTPENVVNKAKVIGEDNKASDTLYPTVGAITTWVSSEISDLSELPVNPGLIEDGTLAGSKLQNGAITEAKIADGAVTTDKIADGAVTEAKLSTDVQETIAGKANADDVYTKGETDSKIVELAVPQPPEDCVSESGLCVLSVTPEGAYAWVNVTAPIEQLI